MKEFAKEFCAGLIERKTFLSNDGSQTASNEQQNSTGECGGYSVKDGDYQIGIGISFDSAACNPDGRHSDDQWLNGVGMKDFGLKTCVEAIADDIPRICPVILDPRGSGDLSHGGSAWHSCLRFSAIAYKTNSGQTVPDTVHIST